MSDCSFLPKSCQINLSSAVLQYSLCFSGERVPSWVLLFVWSDSAPKGRSKRFWDLFPYLLISNCALLEVTWLLWVSVS